MNAADDVAKLDSELDNVMRSKMS